MRIFALAAALVLSLFVAVAHAEGSTLDAGTTAAEGTSSGGDTLDSAVSGSGEGDLPDTGVALPAEPDPAELPPAANPAPVDPPVVVAPPPPPAPVVPPVVVAPPPPPAPVATPVVVAPPPAQPAPVEPAPVEPAPIVTVPQEPPPAAPVPPASELPIREVDPAPAPEVSIVVIEQPLTAPGPAPALAALLSPSSTEVTGSEFPVRSPADEGNAETSFAQSVTTEPAGPPPAALKTLEGPPSAPAPAPSPSGAAGGSGASPAGGSFGLVALLAALLILVPSLLSRLLALSVELMRPTALVFQLKRPG